MTLKYLSVWGSAADTELLSSKTSVKYTQNYYPCITNLTIHLKLILMAVGHEAKTQITMMDISNRLIDLQYEISLGCWTRSSQLR